MEKLIGKEIGCTSYNFRKTIKELVSQSGIQSSYFYVFLCLNNSNEKTVYQSDVVDFLKFKKSTVSVTLANMESDGFIVREKCKEDGRKIVVKLTQKGLESEKLINNVFCYVEDSLHEEISEEELNKFYQVLDKINDCFEGLVSKT